MEGSRSTNRAAQHLPSGNEIAPRYLLLLTPPLDTPESIQEIFDINAGSTTLTHELAVVNDANIISKHFGKSGKAVILHKEQTEQIVEHGNRHKAVYSVSMILLDNVQLTEAVVSSFELDYPLWLFVTEDDTSLLLNESLFAKSRPVKALGWTSEQTGSVSAAVKSAAQSDTSAAKFKLRPAQTVLDRLRHDGSLNENDYRVVYEDRFSGEILLDVSQWAADTSEEEFIPQHRILRFERKWDGVCIWDRKNRLDLLSASSEKERRRLSGRAVLIDKFDQLTSSMSTHSEKASTSTKIQKIQFEFLDSDESVKGIVFGQ